MISILYNHFITSFHNILKNDIMNIITKYEDNKLEIQNKLYFILLMLLLFCKIFLFDYIIEIFYLIYLIINVLLNISIILLIIFIFMFLSVLNRED